MWSSGSRRAGGGASTVGAHGLSAPVCGIFPHQGSNPCPCIGRRILNHWATREVLFSLFNCSLKLFNRP